MKFAITLAFVVVLLAGCLQIDAPGGHHGATGHHGDSGGATEAAAGNLPITGTEDAWINITGGVPAEFRFTPPVVNLQSGDRIGVTFDNQGDLEHEFSIESLDFHLHLAPGTTERAAFIAPKPGFYEFGCYIPGHYESGMFGTLEVIA